MKDIKCETLNYREKLTMSFDTSHGAPIITSST